MKSVVCVLVFSMSMSSAFADKFGSVDHSFDIEFVAIGDPGNPGRVRQFFTEEIEFGSVSRDYRIAKSETSRAAVDSANLLGGLQIDFTFADSVSPGPVRPSMPALAVSWNEAARFVNWLNTSQGFPAAYKFATQPGDAKYSSNENIQLWRPEDVGFDSNNRFRNTQAHYFLPSLHEWYKAAFFDPISETYFEYPTGSNTIPDPVRSGTAAGTAVYGEWISEFNFADVTQAGGLSPYGVMGMFGNVIEWIETEEDMVNDLVVYGQPGISLRGLYVKATASEIPFYIVDAGVKSPGWGFRVASVPEPQSLGWQSLALLVLYLRLPSRRFTS